MMFPNGCHQREKGKVDSNAEKNLDFHRKDSIFPEGSLRAVIKHASSLPALDSNHQNPLSAWHQPWVLDTINTLDLLQLHSSSMLAHASALHHHHHHLLTVVSPTRLEGSGVPPASASRKAKRCQGDGAAKEIFVLLPRQQLWIGGDGGKDKRAKQGEGLGRGERVKYGEEGRRILDQTLWFPPSPACLCRMSRCCVGEFTVRWNLIPNKVTQQILLVPFPG